MFPAGFINAVGLFSGIPAGGSVGHTALNVSVRARSRWAGVFGGVWMLAIVLLFPGLVGKVPMTVLAALMIMAGIGAVDPAEIRSVWRTGYTALLPLQVTFVATLVLSIPAAVGVGVLLTSTAAFSSPGRASSRTCCRGRRARSSRPWSCACGEGAGSALP